MKLRDVDDFNHYRDEESVRKEFKIKHDVQTHQPEKVDLKDSKFLKEENSNKSVTLTFPPNYERESSFDDPIVEKQL